MATIDDAARMALDLDEVSEGVRYGHRAWSVDGKVFAWERPYSKADLRRFDGVRWSSPKGLSTTLRLAFRSYPVKNPSRPLLRQRVGRRVGVAGLSAAEFQRLGQWTLLKGVGR